ncbi:hypothetical protein B0H16DRAFT_1558094 [Mycena metata]|uniref:Uncharacterized protein n=1 Tax=Mycena metata TaxID=1033252 RepID=A0AAD7ILA9_9AGAR|nr:hypothetical protein B0H16DRAFT_1558094 [Mycena metata]
MLDSSPVSLPPVPRPLKRSASVASLPTPPRTHHKRKRAGSKHSSRAPSDEELSATDDDNDEQLIKEAEDEESFWLATNPASTTAAKNNAPSLLYRRLQAQAEGSQTQTQGVPPVSPPPSHRKPPVKTTLIPRTPTPKSPSTVSPPSTPPASTRRTGNGVPTLLRDSPDNPFLSSPLGPQDEVIVNDSDAVLGPQEEKPTMAFVFRGVRRSFPNPYYNTSPTGPNPNSQLPPEHPDFEPEERGVRKLLFGVARKGGATKNKSASMTANRSRRVADGTARKRRDANPRSPSAKSAGRSDEEETAMPTTLNFAA